MNKQMAEKLTAAAAAVIALLVALAGCTGSPNKVEGPQPQATTAQPQPTIDVGQTPAKTPTPKATRAFSAPLGGTVTFPSGVKVSVSKPEVVHAGQYAYGDVDGMITVFTITVTNGSSEPINALFMSVPRVTYGAKGTQAQNAYDTTISVETLRTILPGETQNSQVGYGVPQADVDSLRVEVSGPGFDDFPAIFKG